MAKKSMIPNMLKQLSFSNIFDLDSPKNEQQIEKTPTNDQKSLSMNVLFVFFGISEFRMILKHAIFSKKFAIQPP